MLKTLSPEDRHKYDPVFMQVISSAQADAQSTQPVAAGAIAQMFHREQVSTALQQMAILIAAWNKDTIDLSAVQKCAGALRGLGLETVAERIAALPNIDQDNHTAEGA